MRSRGEGEGEGVRALVTTLFLAIMCIYVLASLTRYPLGPPGDAASESAWWKVRELGTMVSSLLIAFMIIWNVPSKLWILIQDAFEEENIYVRSLAFRTSWCLGAALFLLCGIHVGGECLADPRMRAIEIVPFVIIKTAGGLFWVWCTRAIRLGSVRICFSVLLLLAVALVEVEVKVWSDIMRASRIDAPTRAIFLEGAAAANFDVSRIYVVDSREMSMYYTRGVFVESIMVSEELLRTHLQANKHQQLRALFSHELGHRKNRDLIIEAWLGVVYHLTTPLVASYLDGETAIFAILGFCDKPAIVAWSLAEFSVSLLRSFIQPAERALWKMQEFNADRSAALDGHAEALYAFLKGQWDRERRQSRLYEFLYGTHPSIRDRLARLDAFLDHY